MKRAFADTFFFLALLRDDDPHHAPAVEEHGLQDVLTGDRHFEQAGFNLLLK